MVKDIVKQKMFLVMPSRKAKEEDLPICKDLKDTLKFYSKFCYGMAANMIGKNVTIMVILFNNKPFILVNPEIIQTYGNVVEYTEGCLSLAPGEYHDTKRYTKIKVKYYDEHFHEKIKIFTDIPARSIQHQMDHFKGIIV